jgi:hypothetical protein
VRPEDEFGRCCVSSSGIKFLGFGFRLLDGAVRGNRCAAQSVFAWRGPRAIRKQQSTIPTGGACRSAGCAHSAPDIRTDHRPLFGRPLVLSPLRSFAIRKPLVQKTTPVSKGSHHVIKRGLGIQTIQWDLLGSLEILITVHLIPSAIHPGVWAGPVLLRIRRQRPSEIRIRRIVRAISGIVVVISILGFTECGCQNECANQHRCKVFSHVCLHLSLVGPRAALYKY